MHGSFLPQPQNQHLALSLSLWSIMYAEKKIGIWILEFKTTCKYELHTYIHIQV